MIGICRVQMRYLTQVDGPTRLSARVGFVLADVFGKRIRIRIFRAKNAAGDEKPLAVEGEGLPFSERRNSLLLVGLFKAILNPLLDVADPEGDAALAKLHRAGKLP